MALLLFAVGMGVWSGKQEYDRQVAEGNNYTNWVSIGVVGISNTLLCLIPGGKAVSAYKMATAGGSFVLKTFAVQFGKAVGLGVAAGYATDAGIEVARQLATGTKLSNLEYDRINEAGVTGAIAGGAGAIFGAGVEALANTRLGKTVSAKIGSRIDALKNTRVVKSAATRLDGLVSRGKNAVRSGMDKLSEFSRQQFGWDTFSYVTTDGVVIRGSSMPDNGMRMAEVSDGFGKSGGKAYQSGKTSKGHTATWELLDEHGYTIDSGVSNSGGSHPGRVLTWDEQLKTHTEYKILEELKVNERVLPGSTVVINGTRPPCNPGRSMRPSRGCQKVMQDFANAKNVNILYFKEGDSNPWIFPQ